MTVLVILIIVAVAVFVAMKTGKVKDANNNNIPDAIEKPLEEVKEVVKATVAKVKAPKAPKVEKPVVKTSAKKSTKK
jgi:hypothetical protein